MADRPQFNSVTAHLICRDAASAIDFYTRAFGASEMMRLPDKQGKLMHAAITLNGSTVMLMDEYPDYGARSPKLLGGTAVVLHLMVPDVDAAFDKAIAAGATVVTLSVTLSCDHRSVDGALGAELIGAFKKLIENPVMMIV